MQQQCSAVSCNIADKTKTLEAESELPEIYCVNFFSNSTCNHRMLSCETFYSSFLSLVHLQKQVIIELFGRNIVEAKVKNQFSLTKDRIAFERTHSPPVQFI